MIFTETASSTQPQMSPSTECTIFVMRVMANAALVMMDLVWAVFIIEAFWLCGLALVLAVVGFGLWILILVFFGIFKTILRKLRPQRSLVLSLVNSFESLGHNLKLVFGLVSHWLGIFFEKFLLSKSTSHRQYSGTVITIKAAPRISAFIGPHRKPQHFELTDEVCDDGSDSSVIGELLSEVDHHSFCSDLLIHHVATD